MVIEHIEQIRNWEYKNLEDFVNSVENIENNEFDFKETLNFSRPEEIRKDFSGFANSFGGLIFLGISDSKKIIGVEEDMHLYEKIESLLSSSNLQPGISWEIIKRIPLPNTNPRRYIYICFIRPSLYLEKPHVCEGRIFIRVQGITKPITSGDHVRRLFFTSKFYPEHIDQLEYELNKIQQYKYESDAINAIYLRYLEQYLEESIKERTQKGHQISNFEELLCVYRNIQKLIDEIAKLKFKSRSSTQTPLVSTPVIVVDKYNELTKVVIDFLTKFKKAHNYE